MHSLRFDNSFVRDLPADLNPGPGIRQVEGALFSHVKPTRVREPRLIAHSREVAAMLGISEEEVRTQHFADVFGGNALLEGMQPYAANYGGHQFGNWAGQLGDGRAITLGEVINAAGERWELQLKGAGLTPYSRSADGRAVLRSSIREFLCSEAMHHLGVPTTRALSLVLTGEQVVRDMFYDGNPQHEPGAIVCRVSPSFIRFGNFQLPASRGDTALLKQLVDFTIKRDFPQIQTEYTHDDVARYSVWFNDVCERTAVMIAHWMRVGFVHGVMNTDNMSVLGLTIDYGPYGWIDNMDFGWTPNTTDAVGKRYRFGQQPYIAQWNLGALAGALLSLFPNEEPLHVGMNRFADVYIATDRTHIAGKLGLSSCDDADVDLMRALYDVLQTGEVDMTLFFRALSEVNLESPNLQPFEQAFYSEAKRQEIGLALLQWIERYAARVRSDRLSSEQRIALMRATNPRYVLRNYLAQQAIARAEQGDYAGIHELLDVLRRPYDDQPGKEAFAARRPDWARHKAGCSMLSCSS